MLADAVRDFPRPSVWPVALELPAGVPTVKSSKVAVAVFTMLALSTSVGQSASARWVAAQQEEDWGPFCTVAYENALGMVVGFHGSPGGYVAAYLDLRQDTYPDEIVSVWQVDDGAAHRLEGGPNDYLGYLELEVQGTGLLDEVASGSKLVVTLGDIGQINVPLDGSSAAIKAFRVCLTG